MPYYWKTTNNKQALDQPFTKDGIKYPPQFLSRASEEEKEAIGLEWRPEPEFKNEKWYRNWLLANGDVKSDPIDLDSLKAREIGHTKAIAGSKLSPTDWMVVRAAEGGDAVPEDWATYRAAIRSKSNEDEDKINAMTFEELQEFKHEWAESPSEKVARLEREAAAKEEPNG